MLCFRSTMQNGVAMNQRIFKWASVIPINKILLSAIVLLTLWNIYLTYQIEKHDHDGEYDSVYSGYHDHDGEYARKHHDHDGEYASGYHDHDHDHDSEYSSYYHNHY